MHFLQHGLYHIYLLFFLWRHAFAQNIQNDLGLGSAEGEIPFLQFFVDLQPARRRKIGSVVMVDWELDNLRRISLFSGCMFFSLGSF